MLHLWKHFKTITYHKFLVMKGCFAIGLYWQGIMHDMSKYSWTEFSVGVKYYQGNRSPNNAEREDIGYSSAWLHHKGRNRHHYEYWIDYSSTASATGMIPVKMPDKYIAEMLMDRIAASKVYRGKQFTCKDPLAYYEQGRAHMEKLLHPYTRKILEQMLTMYAEKGEKKTFRYIREGFLHKRKRRRSVGH